MITQTHRDKRQRTPSSLSRKIGKKIPKKTFLIVCEGSETEPEYFKHLKGKDGFNLQATVEINIEVSDPAPTKAINRAIKLSNERKQESKKSLFRSNYDEIWCVFDREAKNETSSYTQAIDKAKQNSIFCATSNPSFEFWLLLHYEYTTRLFQDSGEVEGFLQKSYIQNYDKHITQQIFADLYPRIGKAINHGTRLCNEDHGINPATEVHLLVEKLYKSSESTI